MKILLGIDGSSWSDAAVREVARGPWPEATQVRVVTVDARLGESTLTPGRAGSEAYDEFVQRQRAEVNHNLHAAAQSLRTLAPHLAVSAALLEGAAKEEILAEATRWGADLVVVGSQGRGAIKALLLGSVSLAVVLGAPCSVLVVRPPPDRAAEAI